MKRPDIYNKRDTRKILRYIAYSPPRKWGGFHPQTVKAARSALWYMGRAARG